MSKQSGPTASRQGGDQPDEARGDQLADDLGEALADAVERAAEGHPHELATALRKLASAATEVADRLEQGVLEGDLPVA